MNEVRAPTQEQRKEVLKQYQQGVKPKELSEKTGISINTIKSWINREKAKQSKITNRMDKKKDAPSKQKKTKKGAPVGNKNAEKHGVYSSLYFDSFDTNEKELIENIDYKAEYQLKRQIDLYTIRERRLLQRIKIYEKLSNEKEGLWLKHITSEKGTEKGQPTELIKTEMEAAIGTVLLLESELTKIQRAKNKAIDSLILLKKNKKEWKETSRENELIDQYIRHMMQEEKEETEEEGFLKALNEVAATIWKEEEPHE